MNFLSNLADSLPVVGHVKGIVHYAVGDTEGGNKAMYQATRTSAVLGAGAVGSLGGPGGAALAAMYAGVITDGVASAAMDKPQGVVKGCKNIAEDLKEGKNPTGSIASMGFQVGMDGLGGLGMGGVSSAASQVSGKTVAKGVENIAKSAVKTVGEKTIQKTVKMTGEEVVKTVTKTVTEKAVKNVIATAAVQAEVVLVSTHVCVQADEKTKEEERERREREERGREERQRRDRERREREEREHRERRAREQQEQRAREQQEQQIREQQEQQAREQQERRARELQEQQARELQEQQERLARELQEQRAREQQERLTRELQEQRAREQQERLARELQEQQAREQQERLARELQEQRAREQQERLARELREQCAREQQERLARELQEQQAREQQERRSRELQEQRAREQQQQQAREQQERNSGSSQPPRRNKGNNNRSKNNKPNYFAIFMNLLEEISNGIFGFERPYTRERAYISQIFQELSQGQQDYLGTIIERLHKAGILKEVLKLVIRIFSEHFPEDISFPNFLSLLEFVAAYIQEEIDYRTEVYRMAEKIARENDSSIPKVKSEDLRAEVVFIIMNLADIISTIVETFVRLRFDIETEVATFALTPNFRDIFSAIYHYFKHRCVPGDGVLAVTEYYYWIRTVLDELGRQRRYTDLLQDRNIRNVRANVRFEMYVVVFGRRIRIVVKFQRGTIVLSSCFVLDDTYDDDEEGMVWISISRF